MKFVKNQSYKNYNYMLSLLIIDIIAYFISLVLAYEMRLGFQSLFDIIEFNFSLHYLIFQLWWLLVLLIVFLASFGLYTSRMPFWKESREIFRACFVTFILVFAFVSLGKMTGNVSRLLIIFLWIFSFIFIVIFRYILKLLCYKYGIFMENTVIIGDYGKAEEIACYFSKEPCLGIKIVGIVTVGRSPRVRKGLYPVLGRVASIQNIILNHKIIAAVVVPDKIERYDISTLIGRLQITLSKIMLISDAKELAFSNAEAFQTLMGRLSYLQINNNLKSFFNRFMKRAMDLIIGIIALPFVLIISLVIGISIKLTSKGPIFYMQGRIGRYGKTIKILKFRSMYKDADKRLKDILKNDNDSRREWEKSFKLKNDPRITPIGKFLRQTSLDELPQIFNVLSGKMSIIGPRPVLQEELDKYYKHSTNYYVMVRPGITGLWQISGRSNTGYDFRVAMDTWYVLNWSIWFDIVILLKTPGVVIKKEGAY